MPAARFALFAFMLATMSAGLYYYAKKISDAIVWLSCAYFKWRRRQLDKWHDDMERDYSKKK